MKKSVAMKWVKALRSGKYKQGEPMKLKDSNGEFCCLGVLCDISGKGEFEYSNAEETYQFNNSTLALPEKVTKWAGMTDGLGRSKDNTIELYNLNDTGILNLETGKIERLTFDEIADIIQLNWKDL